MPSWLWQVSACCTEVMMPLSTAEGRASLETRYVECTPHGDGVCIFNCNADEQERRNWPLYCGCQAFNQWFSSSKTCTLFNISLILLIPHLLCLIQLPFFSAQQLRLCQEDWCKMSRGLMGFASCIPPERKQALHIWLGYLIPKQV